MKGGTVSQRSLRKKMADVSGRLCAEQLPGTISLILPAPCEVLEALLPSAFPAQETAQSHSCSEELPGRPRSLTPAQRAPCRRVQVPVSPEGRGVSRRGGGGEVSRGGVRALCSEDRLQGGTLSCDLRKRRNTNLPHYLGL